VPGTGKLGDIKNYLLLFGYSSAHAEQHTRDAALRDQALRTGDHRPIKVNREACRSEFIIPMANLSKHLTPSEGGISVRRRALDPDQTIGLLLMRPQIISDARRHYDGLIRAIEQEGLGVIPAISTFMDNRDACRKFFVEPARKGFERNRE
jgi:cobalamin biosynthesis Mg chelatase CobN